MKKKGYIIAFEGIDNSGKSTQCKKIIHMFRKEGVDAEATSNYSLPIYKIIQKHFQDGLFSAQLKILLFSTMLAEYWDLYMKKAWEKGEIVIFDRYIYSLIVYGISDGLDREWIEKVVDFLPKPDLTLYIDISPEEYQDRVRGRKSYISPYSMERLKKVRLTYLTLAKELNFKVIDGSRESNKVKNLIYSEMKSLMK